MTPYSTHHTLQTRHRSSKVAVCLLPSCLWHHVTQVALSDISAVKHKDHMWFKTQTSSPSIIHHHITPIFGYDCWTDNKCENTVWKNRSETRLFLLYRLVCVKAHVNRSVNYFSSLQVHFGVFSDQLISVTCYENQWGDRMLQSGSTTLYKTQPETTLLLQINKQYVNMQQC